MCIKLINFVSVLNFFKVSSTLTFMAFEALTFIPNSNKTKSLPNRKDHICRSLMPMYSLYTTEQTKTKDASQLIQSSLIFRLFTFAKSAQVFKLLCNKRLNKMTKHSTLLMASIFQTTELCAVFYRH